MSMVETAPSKIQVRNLNFYYGKFHALKNINLDIAKNQVTAFIGPSGCGKSTLLRTFNKMFELYPEQRAEGEILLDGDNIYQQKLENRGLIVMGNEGKGISPELAKKVNHKLLIPNFPEGRATADSLNVAIATAITCSEFRRNF